MAQVGGSITEITLNGRPFSVDAESDIGKKLQKHENELKANGNGTTRLIKKNVPQMIDGVAIAIDNSLGDFEFLKGLNDAFVLFDITIAEPDGSFWAGQAQITGEFKTQSQEATTEVTFMGQNIRRQ